MRKVLFITEDYTEKKAGDAYYCVQDGTRSNHHYPFTIQLIKLETSNKGTSKKEFDSRLCLNDPGIKRFHSKKLAKKYLKFIL